MTDLTHDEIERKYLVEQVIDGLRSIIFLIGFSCCASQSEEKERKHWWLETSDAVYYPLKYRYYHSYGALKIQFINDGEYKYPIIYAAAARDDIIVISGRDDSRPDPYSLVLDCAAVDQTIKLLLPQCKQENSYTLCRHCGNIGIWDLWGDKPICDDCQSLLALPSGAPDPTEPRAAQTERAKMSKGLRWDILERDHFTCVVCGASPSKGDEVKLHVDHILPIAKGGKTEPGNLQTLCEACNLGKSDKMPAQLRLEL